MSPCLLQPTTHIYPLKKLFNPWGYTQQSDVKFSACIYKSASKDVPKTDLYINEYLKKKKKKKSDFYE